MKFHQKWKCLTHDKCIAYTFQQTQLKCILHSRIDQGQRYFRGKQTGLKKIDNILSLPETSFCSDQNRRRRCRNEPKCRHVNCFRNAQEFFSMTAKLQCQRQMHVTTTLGIEPKLRINGYDAGFKRDEYDCNLDTCECQHNGTDPVCGKFYKAF